MTHHLERGKNLYSSGLYKLALGELKKADDGSFSNPELCYYIGLAYTQLREYEQALFYLEQVVSSDLSFLHSYQCRMVLGYIYTETGRFQLAEYEFKKNLEEGTQSLQVYTSLAHVSYIQRKVEASVEFLKSALRLNPDYPAALNSLGFIYAEEELNIPEALAFCRRAVHLKPDSAAYLDSLGWANFKAGKHEEARAYLRKALSQQPNNKDIVRHMKAVVGENRVE